MSDEKHSLARYVQRNGNRIEVVCFKCNCLGELNAEGFDLKSAALFQDAADLFAEFGWTCQTGNPMCAKCSDSQ
jgi:hypothetical protein